MKLSPASGSNAASAAYSFQIIVSQSQHSFLSNHFSSSGLLFRQRAAGTSQEPRRVEHVLPVIWSSLHDGGVLSQLLRVLLHLEFTPSFSADLFSFARVVFSWNMAEMGSFLIQASRRSLSWGRRCHNSSSPHSSSDPSSSSGSAIELAATLAAKLLACLFLTELPSWTCSAVPQTRRAILLYKMRLQRK